MPIPWQPELCHKYTHDNNNYCLDYAPVHVLLRFTPLYSVLLAALALIRVSPFSQIARHLSTVRLETVACLATELLLLLLLFLCVHSLVIVHRSVCYLSLCHPAHTSVIHVSFAFFSVCLSFTLKRRSLCLKAFHLA